MPYYAVRVGRNPGLYPTWDECKAQVDKFPKARYKKFNSQQEALDFVHDRPQGQNRPTDNSSQQGYQGTTASRIKQTNTFTLATNPCDRKHDGLTKAIFAPLKQLSMINKELDVKQKEVDLLKKQKEVEELRAELKESKKGLKASKKTFTSHRSSPYSRAAGHSHTSSANWKQNRTTQFVDLTSHTQQIHTSSNTGIDASTASTISDPTHAEVYTDGACTNNGQKQPQAGIGVYWGPNHPSNVSERLKGRQTNNRAEIHAVVRAVKQAQARGIKNLTVHTDSQFLIDSMTKWVKGWQRKDWKTSTGKPVINRKDFEALLAYRDDVTIHWNHVRGHQGVPGNEAADKLAVAGANKPYSFPETGDDSNDSDCD